MSELIFREKEGARSELRMRRLDFTIEDMFRLDSDSGALRKSVKITVKAQMRKAEIDNFNMWSYNNSNSVERRGEGSLSFMDAGDEYLHFDNIYIVSLSENGTTWTDWGSVEAVFSNESNEEDSLGILSFKGANGHTFDIYNSNISLIPSQIRRGSTVVHSYNGSFIQDIGLDFVRVNLSGTVLHDSCLFPISVVEALESKDVDDGGVAPAQQDLCSFLPGLTGVNYNNVFIESASVVWLVEKRCLNISVVFVGPPQQIGGGNNGN